MESHNKTANSRKKVLLISTGNLCRGGVPTFLLNWIQHANKDKYTFVWYFTGVIEDEEYAEEFIKENVILKEETVQFIKNKISRYGHYFVNIIKILGTDNFDIIHINTGSLILQAEALVAARIKGVKVRVSHSHNCLNENGIRVIFSMLLRMVILHNATLFAACSEAAAKWLIGDRDFPKVELINNCIDSTKYAFSDSTRQIYRDKLGVMNNFVIGHVGRFIQQKNHTFLIDIFREIVNKDCGARLLLIGTGELEERIKEQVKLYNLKEKVLFVGVTDHVENYMCAMDVFVLPSIYEGLPYVGIEAQANGLPCIVSDNVTKEVAVTNLIQFLPLKFGVKIWSEETLLKKNYQFLEREEAYKRIVESSFDIAKFQKYVTALYE